MRSWAILVAIGLAGCSFRVDGAASSGDASVGGDGGSNAGADAAIDALTATIIYGSDTNGDLYTINVDTMQTQLVGPMDDPGAPGTSLQIDALGFRDDGRLVGITASPHFLVTVDPATAQVLSKVAVATGHSYWGATVAPPGTFGAGTTVLVASNDDAMLREVRADGSLRTIGAFGGSRAVAGDIAYVPGAGLFASVTASNCSGTCIARVDATGLATLLATSGPGDLWSLAAVRNELWAIGGNGQIYKVDLVSGMTTPMFTSSLDLSDAAP